MSMAGLDDLKVEVKEMIIRDLKLEDISPEDIVDDAPLFIEGLGLDSLEALQLVVSIEESFGVLIPDENAGKIAFASLNALAGYILKEREKG